MVFFGMFSVIVGIFAIAFPLAMTVAIEQVLGIFLIISGVFSIGAVLFGKEPVHRISSIVLALIRIATGVALLQFVQSGVVVLTTVLGVFFLVEGLAFVFAAFAYRAVGAWIVLLMNGVVALVLAGIVFANLPGDAPWVLGLLYGINSIFYGVSLMGLAAAASKPHAQ